MRVILCVQVGERARDEERKGEENLNTDRKSACTHLRCVLLWVVCVLWVVWVCVCVGVGVCVCMWVCVYVYVCVCMFVCVCVCGCVVFVCVCLQVRGRLWP